VGSLGGRNGQRQSDNLLGEHVGCVI
jgi:hypothetical protein